MIPDTLITTKLVDVNYTLIIIITSNRASTLSHTFRRQTNALTSNFTSSTKATYSVDELFTSSVTNVFSDILKCPL